MIILMQKKLEDHVGPSKVARLTKHLENTEEI